MNGAFSSLQGRPTHDNPNNNPSPNHIRPSPSCCVSTGVPFVKTLAPARSRREKFLQLANTPKTQDFLRFRNLPVECSVVVLSSMGDRLTVGMICGLGASSRIDPCRLGVAVTRLIVGNKDPARQDGLEGGVPADTRT